MSEEMKSAIEVFKTLKNKEMYDENGNRDIEGEFLNAKADLKNLFGYKDEDFKGMSRNNVYMLHQSKMVNKIYKDMIKNRG